MAIVDGDAEIVPGIRVILTPGHTPGGQSVAVETDRGTAVITGFCCNADNFPRVGPAVTPGVHINAIEAYESAQRVKELAEMLNVVDGAKVTTNLWGERWTKLVLNCMHNGLSAVTGLNSRMVAEQESPRRLSIRLACETINVGKALGYDLLPINEAFHAAGFGPKGDLWATINGSLMLTRLKAPGSLNNRWLTEDIPYGIATWSKLGTQYGVDSPLMRAFVDIGSVLIGFDGWTRGRGLEDLGIAGIGKRALRAYLKNGDRS